MQPRRLLSAHIDICPFARLAPLITSQSTRIQALEDENALLRRKVNAFPSPTLPPMTPHDLPPLPEPTYTNSPRPDNFALTSSNETQSIELQTHMITSYESLRSDIDRLSASMSELDARQSVLVMNESLRVKDDFAHLNAVIGSMRVQLHWLMSHRLQNQQQQQQHQPQHQARATPSAGPSTGVGGGGRGPPGRGDDAAGIVRRLSDTLRQETKL
ncbi:MAG: hypothetical protein M1837_007398 [Sclerophora amabilis]|nr:MAG: hypothetical protein M1837_007398 [Sclerophora amabilis]